MREQKHTGAKTSSLHQEIIYLTEHFTETIRDPIWKDIPLSRGFIKLLSSQVVQKLNHIKQLGPAFLLYPGAVHTRLDHSLGVYHVTRLMILSLITRKSFWNFDHLFSHEGIQGLLCAALLHDIGHFPYAHVLKEMVDIDHEVLGANLIHQEPELRSIITEHIGTSVDIVSHIIDTSLPCTDPEILFYRTMLSGTLDPDKLDYLNRDAFFCGVPYGVQDVAYITRRITLSSPGVLSVPIEAIGSVEHLLFSKYLMYQNVYWHHKTRAATAMMKKALYLLMREHTISQEDLFNLDDDSFFRLLLSCNNKESSDLVQSVKENKISIVGGELSFSPSNAKHRMCTSITERNALEQQLFSLLQPYDSHLQPHQVIIDIPEEVSFESDIPIVLSDGKTAPFSHVDELFSPAVVSAFTSSLRKIRLFLPYSLSTVDVQQLFSECMGSSV